jgi:hypothetical protein
LRCLERHGRQKLYRVKSCLKLFMENSLAFSEPTSRADGEKITVLRKALARLELIRAAAHRNRSVERMIRYD